MTDDLSPSYTERGSDLVLDSESTTAFNCDPKVADAVSSMAWRHMRETGHSCTVFADDGTVLLRWIVP